MRIFYDHQVFSLQNNGGGSRYYYELLKYLAAVPDVQMELMLGLSSTSAALKRLVDGNARVTAYAGLLNPGPLRYLINEALSNSMLPFRGKMDVYHATHHRLMPGVRSRRIIVTHHDCTHERFPHLVRHAKQVIRAKEQLYRRADAIICVSESARRDLINFYGTDIGKTRVIHHGLAHLPRSTAAQRELHARVRRDYLLFVGKRGFYKNARALITAFRESRLHECLDLVFLGGGPFSGDETTFLKHLGVTEAVVSFPHASDELLGQGYAGAKLFVYPSLWEGFGFPPLEAMDAGCPVLASQSSSIPEVCRDAAFYFDPQNQESLMRELLRAIHDQEARQTAVRRGREVASGYSWNKCGAETLAFYRECL
jgi:glycosyltransferase involved in cell wall biosynthesis